MARGHAAQPRAQNNQRRTDHEAPNRLRWAEFVFVVIVAFATSYAAYYTGQQWVTARETETVSNRAYVISNSIRLISYGTVGDKERQWQTASILENVGNTPTKRLHYITMVGFCPVFPVTDATWENGMPWVDPSMDSFIYNLIGPKAEIDGTAIPTRNVTNSCNIAAISEGLIKYRDIFNSFHLVEFCSYVQGTFYRGIDFQNYPSGQAIRVRTLPCPKHNCSDEECGTDWYARAKDLK